MNKTDITNLIATTPMDQIIKSNTLKTLKNFYYILTEADTTNKNKTAVYNLIVDIIHINKQGTAFNKMLHE